MIENVKNYIVDNKFRLTLYKNMIHIINYTKIIALEGERAVILSPFNKVTITGKNLHLSRLLEEEVLIEGEVLNIGVENV